MGRHVHSAESKRCRQVLTVGLGVAALGLAEGTYKNKVWSPAPFNRNCLAALLVLIWVLLVFTRRATPAVAADEKAR